MKTIRLIMLFVLTCSIATAQEAVKDRSEQKIESQARIDEEWTPEKSFLAQYDSLVTAYARSGSFNGVALVAKNGNVLYKKAFGFRDAEKKIAHDASDIFQIGSITKQITVAVIMQLQNEGKLSVSDKLEKYFPGFINGNKITIEHLLTHTSGLHNYTDDTVLLKSDVTKHYTRDAMIRIFKSYPSDFEPGSKWNYSNSGYSMLGFIIEKVTGKPYEKVVRERIFSPLGMNNSGFDYTRLKAAQRSKGYYSLAEGAVMPAPIVDSTIGYAAGAVYSTVDDLLKWERAIATDKLLSQASWKQVFTPYKNNYGYGWGIGTAYAKPFQAHSGGIHGFASYLIRFPEDGLSVILLDNASSASLAVIANQLAAITFGKSVTLPKAQKEIQVDKTILEKYAGEYQLVPGFSITIRVDGNQLKAQATGQDEFPVFAESENMFFYKVVKAKIEFVKDASGKVTSMILHQNGQSLPGEKIN